MGGIDLFVCAQDTGVFFSVFLSVPGWKKGGRHTWQGVLRGRSPPPVRACGLQRRCGLCANPLEETALAAPVEYCGGRGGGGSAPQCSAFTSVAGIASGPACLPSVASPTPKRFTENFLFYMLSPPTLLPLSLCLRIRFASSLPPWDANTAPALHPLTRARGERKMLRRTNEGNAEGRERRKWFQKKKKNATPGRARSAARTTAHRRWNEG